MVEREREMTGHLPLEGIKVIELAHWVLGPAAGCVLGEWGAEVIKVEDPRGGDALRGFASWGLRPKAHFNYYWQFLNRNKRSIAVDLQQEQGRQIIYKLLEGADVLVSNFRLEVLHRLGLDYESVARINPSLVYAQATGFGLNGPDKDRPAFDETAFWTRSGIMSILGEPDGPPVMLRGALGDLPTGTFLAGGVAVALLARQRFGVAQRVDTSLLLSGIWVNGVDIQTSLSTGVSIEKRSRKKAPNPLYTTYQTRDGKWLQFQMLQTDRFWPRLCQAIGREDLDRDPRFDTHEKRVQSSEMLISMLSQAIAARDMAEWRERFNQYGLIWEPETTISEVLADPQVSANEYLVELQHPEHGPIKLVSTPLKFSHTPARPRRPAPELGEHTEEVLLEAGYSWEEISKFKENGVTI